MQLKLYYYKTGKHLSDTFPAKNALEQGDVLFSLLFKFATEYVIKNIHEFRIEFKLIHKLLLRVKKVKCTLVQALRLCTGRTAHRGSRGIALPFHDHGTRRG